MKIIKTKWFWWWGWNPQKLEDWLEEMASYGWNLYQVDMWGIRFKFRKEKSEKIRYCVDYQSSVDENYLSILKDDGWDIVWTGATGWYLLKKIYEEKRPSIFTDANSLIERNNRLTKILKPLFVLIIAMFIFLIINRNHGNDLFIGLYIVLISFYGYLFYQIHKYNKKLKNNIKE